MSYKKTNTKIDSGSDRDKFAPTKKQNKWANLFYAFGKKRSIALKERLKKAEKALKEKAKQEKKHEL